MATDNYVKINAEGEYLIIYSATGFSTNNTHDYFWTKNLCNATVLSKPEWNEIKYKNNHPEKETCATVKAEVKRTVTLIKEEITQ